VFTISAGASATPCNRGKFCPQAAHASQLLQVLTAGVEQCYNKNQTKAIRRTHERLDRVAEELRQATVDWAKKDKQKLAAHAAMLANELQDLDRSPGFPADLYCRTNRKCLEAGFEGNKKYPNCLPVKDDIHANVQYVSLEELLNTTLPAVTTLLKSEADKATIASAKASRHTF
jgi:hypothetical protein